MGTDNLFHKRKAKSSAKLKRSKVKRDAYAKVLVVCEGEKTEPKYFEGLRQYYALNTANVEVCGECGSDPMSVLSYAKQRYREEKDAGDAFDKVFCVFDKDAHANYMSTLSAIATATPYGVYEAINSVPCFEYWLLLHFDYSTKPYVSTGRKSSGEQVLAELKRYLPAYEKGADCIFKELIDQLEFAQANAKRSLTEAESQGTDNPSTRVHELVAYLQSIKAV